MQKRSVRWVVLTLLLVTPLAAAYFLWSIGHRIRELAAAEDAVAVRLDRMSEAVAGIGTAQQSYVAPGQLDEPWFERVSTLVRQLTDDTASIAPLLRSADAAAMLEALADSIQALTAADRRARENLGLGQELMAADVIFSDGRNLLDGMIARLRDLRGAERAWYRGEATALTRQRWLLLGGVALLWVGALVMLISLAAPKTTSAVTTGDTPAPGDLVEAAVANPVPVDLAALAGLCTSLARVSDKATLSRLLGRAAAVLDASGLMLWLGAGEQLFAVLGHGYPPETVARFGPLARASDSAAAAAWRTESLLAVPGEGRAKGALVAPMFGPERCIGVLALEIRAGREQDPAIQSVAAIVAAQLATAVSAWPAASPAESPETEARSA